MHLEMQRLEPLASAMNALQVLLPRQQFAATTRAAWQTQDCVFLQGQSGQLTLTASDYGYEFIQVWVPCERIAGEPILIPFNPIQRLLKGGSVAKSFHLEDNLLVDITGREVLDFEGIRRETVEVECAPCQGTGWVQPSAWQPAEVCNRCDGEKTEMQTHVWWNDNRIDGRARSRQCPHPRVHIPGLASSDGDAPVILASCRNRNTYTLEVGEFQATYDMHKDALEFPAIPSLPPLEVATKEEPNEVLKRMDLTSAILSHIRKLFGYKKTDRWLVTETDEWTRIQHGNVSWIRRK